MIKNFGMASQAVDDPHHCLIALGRQEIIDGRRSAYPVDVFAVHLSGHFDHQDASQELYDLDRHAQPVPSPFF